jgi:hypothetical protein
MGILNAYRVGDVFLDYPFDDVKFRWEKETSKVFRRFYGEAEQEISWNSNLFRDAMSTGKQITREEYYRD